MSKYAISPESRVLICVNEFFGAWNTGYGGYGFLARHLLPQALNLPNQNIDICLGRSKQKSIKKFFFCEKRISEEGITLVRLPRIRALAAQVVNSYDYIITIEATVDFLFSLTNRIKKPIIFWIQDPRPKTDWSEINTVKLAKEPCYWDDNTYKLVNKCNSIGLIKFATHANYLSEKAKELYSLPKETVINFLPDPINVEWNLDDFYSTKENNIVFLGRLDSVKRGWLFCEIAKKLPQYDFYVLGESSNNLEKKNNLVLNDSTFA